MEDPSPIPIPVPTRAGLTLAKRSLRGSPSVRFISRIRLFGREINDIGMATARLAALLSESRLLSSPFVHLAAMLFQACVDEPSGAVHAVAKLLAHDLPNDLEFLRAASQKPRETHRIGRQWPNIPGEEKQI